MRSTRLYAALLISVMFAGIFSHYAFSSLMNNIVIQSTGRIATEVYAASGSASDIQAAVNLISSVGGTVYVPAGTFHWNGETVTIPGGVNVIGASPAGCKGHEDNWESYTPSTILHNNFAQGDPDMPSMFIVDGWSYPNKPSRISGIQFEATAPTNPTNEAFQNGFAIWMFHVLDFRVDHCTFINFCDIAVFCDSLSASSPIGKSRGVIDHCVVDNPYKLSGSGWLWGYGFVARGDWKTAAHWDTDITHFIGQYDSSSIPTGASIMFVEDCHLSRTRHATDGSAGAWEVIRYNLIDNSIPPYGDIGMHGATDGMSGRGFEVYENTMNEIVADDGNDIGVRLRGGSGFIFNNRFTMDQNSPNAYLLYLDREGNIEEQFVKNTYIWNNVYTKSSFLNNRGDYTENIDYFLRAPNQQQDGFTYTPYPYPHPLTLQQ